MLSTLGLKPVAVPVAVFVVSVWLVHRPDLAGRRWSRFALPVVTGLVLLSSLTSEPVLIIGLLGMGSSWLLTTAGRLLMPWRSSKVVR